jgi:tetratricopeptide (TPR) repeat protein
MRIAVYAIAKNEEKFVNRFMDSCVGADGVYILDTGSSDSTVSVFKARGAHVSTALYEKFRFDVARNDSLSLVPKDFDVCVCIDIDEVLVEDWRDKVEACFRMDINHLEYLFAWSMKDEKTPNFSFRYDKIHRRHGFVWRKPVHEHVCCSVEKKSYFLETVLVHHFPDPSKSRAFYFDLLKLSTEDEPLDSRCSFYYARELYYAKKYKESIEEFKRYLNLESAKWNLERSAACSMAAICLKELGDSYSCEQMYLRGCSESPYEREPWCDLANFYRVLGNHPGAYAAAVRALSIHRNGKTFLNTTGAWAEVPHDMASIASFYLGLKQESLAHALNAFRHNPHDSRLANNYRVIASILGEKKRIHVLWPTKRIVSAKNSAENHWIGKASDPNVVDIYFGVDGFDKFDVKTNGRFKIIETTKTRNGVAQAAFELSHRLVGKPGDLVVLASDDFEPPEKWDQFLFEQFNAFDGSICVNNGHPPYMGLVCDIPIMEYSCLKRLEGVIYHPAYSHCYSDNELYDILTEKGWLKDLRGSDTPTFVHHHWRLEKRKRDEIDASVDYMASTDCNTYNDRKSLSCGLKLFVEKERIADRLDLLEKFVKPGMCCAEVGVYRAEYSSEMLKRCSRGVLFLVDTWGVRAGYSDYTHSQQEWDFIYSDVVSKFKNNSEVVTCRKDSIEACESFKQNYLDFVYIDANHSYEKVIEDIRAWWKKVKNGGVISGHDYKADTVYQAVHDFMIEIGIGKHLFYVTEDPYPSWMIKKEIIGHGL